MQVLSHVVLQEVLGECALILSVAFQTSLVDSRERLLQSFHERRTNRIVATNWQRCSCDIVLVNHYMLQHLRLLFQSVSVETLLDFVQTAIQGQSSARKCVQFLDVQSILHASHHLFQAFSRRSTCKKVHLSAQ
jgi:hypothetical protein